MCCGSKGGGKSSSGRSRLIKKKKKVQHIQALMSTPISGKFVLCRPQFYGIRYSINPWMDLKNDADRPKAIYQWNQLVGTLRLLHAQIIMVKPRKGLPDMVFTANAGFFPKNQEAFILSNFKFPERKEEEQWFEKFFHSEGYFVKKVNGSFEGAGDCLYLNDCLIAGYGFRTEASVYDSFLLNDVLKVQLVDPRFYHLDTCFCPLNGDDYLIWPGAFSSDSLEKIRERGNELAVPEEEAIAFACNAVVIGKSVILPTGCPKTVHMLQDTGYKTYTVPMSEFIKSGGGPKCLTLRIN